MGKDINVIIVEDHDMARMGLSVILGSNSRINILDTASDGQEGVDKALKLKPDVVIMDIGLPTIDGIEATGKIKMVNPDIKVLMYTSREGDDDIFDSFNISRFNTYCLHFFAIILNIMIDSVYQLYESFALQIL